MDDAKPQDLAAKEPRTRLPKTPTTKPHRAYVFSAMVGMARRAVPARVVAGGTNNRTTLAFEGVAPLHAAWTSRRDVPTALNTCHRVCPFLALQRSPQDRRQRHGEQETLRLLPLPARNERGEGRGEGKTLKTLPENDPVFARHPSTSLSGNTASRAATSRGAPDWRKRSARFSLSSGRGLG